MFSPQQGVPRPGGPALAATRTSTIRMQPCSGTVHVLIFLDTPGASAGVEPGHSELSAKRCTRDPTSQPRRYRRGLSALILAILHAKQMRVHSRHWRVPGPLCAAGQSLVSMRLHCRKLCNHSLYDSQKGRWCHRKDADVAPDGARRSRDRGYSFGWAWLSAPASRLRAEDCVPPPLRASLARSFRGTA